MYDILVVGSGPAGMTAALYGLRNGKTVQLFEKNGIGGQIASSPKVENIPGFQSISGEEFVDKMYDQILALGCDIEFAEITGIYRKENGTWQVLTDDHEIYEAKSIILATGVKHRLLGLKNEEDFIGNGISFCAVCDGDFYSGKTVCMVGGGNSALQEAILLSEKCQKVIILQDLPMLTGEEKLQEILRAKENVDIITNQQILEYIIDEDKIVGMKAKDKITEKETDYLCDGIFLAIGLIPENKNFAECAELNEYGYFNSTENCTTKTEGLFVAGDCRQKTIRQVTTAMADGTIAALKACEYLNRKEH